MFEMIDLTNPLGAMPPALAPVLVLTIVVLGLVWHRRRARS